MTGVRRVDPDRKDRIVDAALDVVAEHGVAGTTHRVVAAAADVPLGSMTYHFENLDELLRLAFERHAAQAAARFEAAMAAVPEGGDPVEAIVALVCDESGKYQRDLLVALELYVLAARKPAFRTVTHRWMAASRAALRRHVDADVVPDLDALIEGLVLHAALSTEASGARLDPERVRRAVRRQVG
ncbi:TetR/AcrR family transcriptional regulator [Oerskovia sp. NPDC056781]|uniref:TetR/AcrR family transcriptional regulator n=1 Tax=Oerskovia sp. NPDC056781 TaxID=3345942 RepID=UPI00366E1C4B